MAIDKSDIASAIGRAAQGSLAGQTQTAMNNPPSFDLRRAIEAEMVETQRRMDYLQEALGLLERNPDIARLMELRERLGLSILRY